MENTENKVEEVHEDALATEEMKEVEAVFQETSEGQDENVIDSDGIDNACGESMQEDGVGDEHIEDEICDDDDDDDDGQPAQTADPREDSGADMKMDPEDSKDDYAGSSEDPLKMPPHGTEVYIGGLAKSATDTQIKEFCEAAGEVFNLRCTKDPGIPGKNRGYAFVTYKTTEQATSAVEKLNKGELKDFPGKMVRVIMSQVKNRLFIGNVPKDLKHDDIQAVLDKEVRGVIDVELLMDREQNLNRGFCFVEFYNHSAADLARKILSRPDFRLRDRVLTVTWAEPKKIDSDQEQVKSIYVGNLPESVSEAKLRDVFKAYGEVEKVVLPPGVDSRRFREYGFVHYTERACALKAIEAAEEEKPTLDKKELTVAMAKPPTQMRDSADPTRRLTSTLLGASRLGMGGLGMGLMRGRSRPMAGRMMGYGGEYGYGEMDHGYGAYAAAAAGRYQVSGMALVPMYLPNGQVGFVFQQQAAAMLPGAGGPVRGTKAADLGPAMGGYASARSGDRGEYGGSYGGSYGNRYARSYSRPGAASQRDQQGSRYRPY